MNQNINGFIQVDDLNSKIGDLFSMTVESSNNHETSWITAEKDSKKNSEDFSATFPTSCTADEISGTHKQAKCSPASKILEIVQVRGSANKDSDSSCSSLTSLPVSESSREYCHLL